MAHPPSPPLDPAQDAAALLRRIGFGTLMVVAPLAALVARRALVILVPIGVALLIIAAALDGGHRDLARSLQRIRGSLGWLAGGLLLLWAALSLVWTPFPGPAAERLGNIAAMIGLGVAGYLALPERMRSANLYLVPVGVALAALAAIALALLDPQAGRGSTQDGQSLERGLLVLVMALWPALAWLRSRGRTLEGVALGLAVAVATLLGPDLLSFAAFAVAAAVFALTALAPRLGVRAVAIAMAALVVLAPLLPFVGQPLAEAIGGAAADLAQTFAVWRDVVLGDPARLVTGHGLETALRNRFIGRLSADAPNSLLFEIWYELGLVGALAGACALAAAASGAARNHPALAPGAAAAFACAFALACLGVDATQVWWFTALLVTTLIFVAVERGQVRTTRPKANLFLRPANDA